MISISVWETGTAGPRRVLDKRLCDDAASPSAPVTIGNDRWRLENLRAEDPTNVGDLLVLDEPEMSGVHARLQWTGGRWRLHNLSVAYPLRVRPWGYERPILIAPSDNGEAARILRHPRLAISFEPGAATWLVAEPAGEEATLEVAPGWDEALATYAGTAPGWVRGFLAGRPLLADDEPPWGNNDERAELRRPGSAGAITKTHFALAARFAPFIAWPPREAEPQPLEARTAWKAYTAKFGGAESTPRMLLDKLMDDITHNRAVFSPGVGGFSRAEDFLTFCVDTHALRRADLADCPIETGLLV